MDRVYQSNAVGTPPATVPSSGNFPTSGNKAIGQLATVPGPYWFYSVTEEIRNAIIAMGLTPSPSSVDQLAAALKKTVRTVNHREPDDSGNVDNPIRYVGDEWHSFTGQIPAGGVPYCGQAVSRSVYADLWAYAQAQGLVKTEAEWQAVASSKGGNVPYYSSGDGSTTFRMPRVVGYVRGASSQSEAGQYVAEGLPNITGNFRSDGQGSTNGAFYDIGLISGGLAWNVSGNDVSVGFDASRSNPIYGNSDHVTPETSVVLFGVYAFGEIVNTGSLDAETLATGLATVESNLEAKLAKTTPHIIETWKSSDNTLSWYRKWSDGFIEQGGYRPNAATGDQDVQTTFHTPFMTNNINVFKTLNTTTSSNLSGRMHGVHSITKTSFKAYVASTSYMNGFYWYACGY